MNTAKKKWYAAIDKTNPTGCVYAVARTIIGCERVAQRIDPGSGASFAIVDCTPAAARYINRYGGAPDAKLTVSPRSGVEMREEEP